MDLETDELIRFQTIQLLAELEQNPTGGIRAAIWAIAALTAASGVVVALRMYESHPRQGR